MEAERGVGLGRVEGGVGERDGDRWRLRATNRSMKRKMKTCTTPQHTNREYWRGNKGEQLGDQKPVVATVDWCSHNTVTHRCT